MSSCDRHHSSRASRRGVGSLVWLLLFVLLGAWGYQRLTASSHSPEAVLVLGGSLDREQFAADFAHTYPDLPIWVSSGSNPEYAQWVFEEANIDLERVHLDYRAVDTVSNFTTLVDDFKSQGIDRIYLITSDYHMRRARIIGEIVLGSRGISFEAIAVPSDQSPESIDKVLRDAARSILWVTTGYSGSSLRQVQQAAYRHFK
ncbi:MAG: YdcF family protein [Synechococcales cyanobacterium K44_A2020_017]|nr:YdcF family protein [Synechococcales cyanobacterium K32_A2020_035]MBF2094484.1 YdcF family protein [Synechococcales cyanobacterium K44_A2020_017]